MFAILGNGYVKAYTVKPSAEFGFTPKIWIGPPDLYDDILEKILTVDIGFAIQAANFINQQFMLFDQFFKRLVQIAIFQFMIFWAIGRG